MKEINVLTTPVKFENPSVSGVERMYRKFVLKVPGHSTVTLPVPTNLVDDITEYLQHNHPAIVVTVFGTEVPEVPEVPEEKEEKEEKDNGSEELPPADQEQPEIKIAEEAPVAKAVIAPAAAVQEQKKTQSKNNKGGGRR